MIEALPMTGDAQQLLTDLEARGLKHGTAYGAMVPGLTPVGELPGLQALGSLRYVRPAYAPRTDVGAVTGQGGGTLGGDRARERFGFDGEAVGIANGDLPDDVEVLLDFDSLGTDEGRGTAEIVHDVAPGAELAFRTASLGQPDFAQGIEDLRAAGCDVVASSQELNIGADPVEGIQLDNLTDDSIGVDLVITKVAGPDPTRVKYVNSGDAFVSEYATNGSTLVGHPNAPRAVAVAAAPYFLTPNLLDSLGGLDFEGDGFPNFFGTSASAPYVAAVAALLLEATYGYISPQATTSVLAATAEDMDNPLTDYFYRHGRGLTSPSDEAPLEQPLGEGTVSIFPNPSSGPVTFRATGTGEEAIKLTLHNSVGQQVFSDEYEQPVDFTQDFGTLPKGRYIARMQTGAEVTTLPIVLEWSGSLSCAI